MPFKNKGVVITGAASGIGLACAKAFAAAGASVLLADVESVALERAAGDLASEFQERRILAQTCDVSDRSDVGRLAEYAFRTLGCVHILFNNAGVGISGPMLSASHADMQWVLGVNLWGAIHGVEMFAPRMVSQGHAGNIVFTSSFAGLVHSASLGAYCVSKAGVVALAEVLRQELRDSEIGVSVVCPMQVATNIGSANRNRSPTFSSGAETASFVDPRQSGLPGSVIESEVAAARILSGIENNELYILTHEDGRPFVAKRFDRLDQAFTRQFPGS